MTDQALLEAALSYAALGWRVFPVEPRGKRPLFRLLGNRGWADAATDDEEQVRSWWTTEPRANVGLACGSGSSVWVLDSDLAADHATGEVTKDGERLLARLATEAGEELPATVCAATPSGGRHRFLAWDDAVPVGCPRLWSPHVDVKGEGGYVVLPPSVHPTGGRYTWTTGPEEDDPASAPSWVLEAISRAPEPEEVNGSPPEPREVPEGRLAELAEALDYVPPSIDYPAWIEVAMGLHDETGGSEEGFELFHGWSARASGMVTPSGNPAYRGEEDCRRHWRSFGGGGRNPVGAATVFHHARQSPDYCDLLASRNDGALPALEGGPSQVSSRPVAFWRVPPPMGLDLRAALGPELEWLRIYLDSVGDALPAPREFGVVMALGMASGAVGGRYEVGLPDTGWTEPSPLWVLAALPSGGGKSPVIRELRRPLDEWDRRQDRNQEAISEWKARLLVARARLEGLRAQLRKVTISPERVEEAAEKVRETELQIEVLEGCRPPLSALTCSDMTTPAMVKFLGEHDGRGLLLDSEGGVFRHVFGGHSDLEKSADAWLKAYSCEQISEKRIGSGTKDSAERFVRSPVLAVAVATQTDALQLFADSYAEGKGFLARFLVATFPYVLPDQAVSRERVSERGRESWRRALLGLLEMGRPAEPVRIDLSLEAAGIFEEWLGAWLGRARDDLVADSEDPLGYGSSRGAKLRGATLRLALALHCLAHPVPEQVPISAGLMRRVLEVWEPFFRGHARRLDALVGDDPDRRLARRVLRLAARRGMDGQSASRGELRHLVGSGGRGRVRRVDDLNGALVVLSESGWIYPEGREERRGDGRHMVATRYRMHRELGRWLEELSVGGDEPA